MFGLRETTVWENLVCEMVVIKSVIDCFKSKSLSDWLLILAFKRTIKLHSQFQ